MAFINEADQKNNSRINNENSGQTKLLMTWVNVNHALNLNRSYKTYKPIIELSLNQSLYDINFKQIFQDISISHSTKFKRNVEFVSEII